MPYFKLLLPEFKPPQRKQSQTNQNKIHDNNDDQIHRIEDFENEYSEYISHHSELRVMIIIWNILVITEMGYHYGYY